jgi:serine protease Do
MRRLASTVLTALFLAVAAPPAGAQLAPSPEFKALAGGLKDSIVAVRATIVSGATSSETLGDMRQGTGVLIGSNLVVTIGYLVLEADRVEVVGPDGRRNPVINIGYDHTTGFGVLKTLLPVSGKPLQLGASETLREEEKLLTIGSGEDEAVEVAVLARQPFTASWEYALDRAIYTTPPVDNWSGAALVDRQGKLVGIGSLLLRRAGTTLEPGNMYVPVDLLKPVLDDLAQSSRSNKSAPRPWLGMAVEETQGRLVVARVTPGGPADQAGVQSGDVLLGVGGAGNPSDVKSLRDYYDKLWSTGAPGSEISVRMLVDRTPQTLTLKSVDRADFMKRQTVD